MRYVCGIIPNAPLENTSIAGVPFAKRDGNPKRRHGIVNEIDNAHLDRLSAAARNRYVRQRGSQFQVVDGNPVPGDTPILGYLFMVPEAEMLDRKWNPERKEFPPSVL